MLPGGEGAGVSVCAGLAVLPGAAAACRASLKGSRGSRAGDAVAEDTVGVGEFAVVPVVSSTCRASVEGNRVEDAVAEDSRVGEGEGEGVGDLVGEGAVTPDFLMLFGGTAEVLRDLSLGARLPAELTLAIRGGPREPARRREEAPRTAIKSVGPEPDPREP